MIPLVLASSSESRKNMLHAAGVAFESHAARIDEESITDALLQEGARARDVSDVLAEQKARKVSSRFPDALVLGSDQTLALGDAQFSKPASKDDAKRQLLSLRGQTHTLFSAAVIYHELKPVWRAVGTARLTMHHLTEAEIEQYLDLAWPRINKCVGGYEAEGLGARLFARIDGDWFSVLGMPLLDILSYLRLRGDTL